MISFFDLHKNKSFNKDVAAICQRLLTEYEGVDPIILSNSYEVSIKQVVELVCDIMNFTNKIVWDSSKPDGQLRKPTDTSNLHRVLPDLQFTPLEKALQETIQYFEQNYEKIRK